MSPRRESDAEAEGTGASEEGAVEGAPGPAAGEPQGRLAQDLILRDAIIDHLRRSGHDSISGLARVLSLGRPKPIHRLTVAGYLQAMAESGMLTEIDRPPSKEYRLASPEAHLSLHQRVWRVVQDLPKPEPDRVRIALATLQHILGRPIFHAELLHAGILRVPEDIPRVVLQDGPRRALREQVTRRPPRIEVPQRDPLLQLTGDDPYYGHSIVLDMIRRTLVKATNAEHLVAERAPAAAQTSLDRAGA